ncbi:MAG: TonB family protein, partial [Chitinivibrionales bacterium]|nr:TonB family protein [Chitinivibrionales bacterium]
LLTPQVSYRDSLLEFALSARISAQNIQDVSVVRINGSRQDCISSIKDDCGRSDGKMHDHVYTLRFKYKPSPLDQFMYRLKVVTAHDSAYSGLFHRSATAPIRRYRFIELKTTEDMMHMLYNRLKESGMPALGARDSVVSWLKQQQCVSSVQKVDSLFSFIKITFKQGVWCNVDLDMKPVYSFEEKVGTINWGVDAVLEPLEIQWNVEKYASNKQNRTKDGLSPVEYRFFNVSSTGTAYARSVEALLNILQAQSKFVYHAYFHHLTKQPDIEGTITVRFSITESGSVADCMLIDSAIHDSLFVEEVVSKVKKWSFESVTRPGDITIVEYPFFFHRPR